MSDHGTTVAGTGAAAGARVRSQRAGTPPAARPVLLGLGTAVPTLCRRQADVAAEMAEAWELAGAERRRFERIVAGTRIDERYAVAPIDEVFHATTHQRMLLYEQHAPALALAASRRALGACDLDPQRVTDVVVVTCTGFSAPGVDVALVRQLGLQPTTRRTVVGFMGCFGAIIGLRTAAQMAAMNPQAVVLVVCVELCSLHWRSERSVENQVASVLFGDGAAAAIVAGEAHAASGAASAIGHVLPGRSLLVHGDADDEELMSWRVTDAGFAMTLRPKVPEVLGTVISGYLRAARGAGELPRGGFLAVHPGGPNILDAVDAALNLRGGGGLDAAWAVLRRYGNMSSATVLFVLAEALQRGWTRPATLIAFGPGLSVESVGLA